MAFLQSGEVLLHSHPEQDFDHIGNEAAGCSQIDRSLWGRKAHVFLPMAPTGKMDNGISSKVCPPTAAKHKASGQNGQDLEHRKVDSKASDVSSSLFHRLYSSDAPKKCPGGDQRNRLLFLRKRHDSRSSRHIPPAFFLPQLLNFFNNISKCQQRFEAKHCRQEVLCDLHRRICQVCPVLRDRKNAAARVLKAENRYPGNASDLENFELLISTGMKRMSDFCPSRNGLEIQCSVH